MMVKNMMPPLRPDIQAGASCDGAIRPVTVSPRCSLVAWLLADAQRVAVLLGEPGCMVPLGPLDAATRQPVPSQQCCQVGIARRA